MIKKFFNIDKTDFLYSILILSLLGIIFLSCTAKQYEPQKKENKYYFGYTTTTKQQK